jgi:hypothetical protein
LALYAHIDLTQSHKGGALGGKRKHQSIGAQGADFVNDEALVNEIKAHLAGLTFGDEVCKKVCPNGLVLLLMHSLLTGNLISHNTAPGQDGWSSTDLHHAVIDFMGSKILYR